MGILKDMTCRFWNDEAKVGEFWISTAFFGI